MFRRRHRFGSSNSKWHRFTLWIKTHKKIVIPAAIIIALLLAAGGYVLYRHLTKSEPQPVTVQPKEEKPPEPVRYFSELTGREVSKEESERPVTAIMIENSPAARPQSGVVDAGVVFEAIAEGGITRYLALYQESQPALIGPVRSLRPYYVDWLASFDASVIHIGGSAHALDEVRNGNYRDIDQFFFPDTYWRATDRYAPHNVYTNFERLNAINQEKGYTTSSFEGFERKEPTPAEAPDATTINVNVSGPLYNSSYNYDQPTNSYFRFVGGHADRNREDERQIQPNVVVVMKVPHQIVFEDGYRESLATVGSGEVWVFQDGTVTKGHWHKPNRESRITFTDENNDALKLNPGMTWLTAIPTEQTVTWQ